MDIVHDEKLKEFYTLTPSGKAFLRYHDDKGEVNFHYTYTPPSERGKGLAAKITKFAFEWARKKRIRVISGCPYIRGRFLEEYPEYEKDMDLT